MVASSDMDMLSAREDIPRWHCIWWEALMKQDEAGRFVSDDGKWMWDGNVWVSTASKAVPAPQSDSVQPGAIQVDAAHPLSPDGTQWWNGSAWQPAPAIYSTPPAAHPGPGATADPGMPAWTAPNPGPPSPTPGPVHLSPDGRWRWDGTTWVPTQ